jgi:hypothetical protein
MSRAVRTVRYTETITRSFRLNVGEDDASKVIPGLRDGSLKYVYDDDDRTKGAVVNDCGQSISLTTEDYGLVMKRDNFRSEVEWPDKGIIAWFWDNKDIHGWFTRGFMVLGWIFVLCLMLSGHKEYAEARGVVILLAMALPLFIQTIVLSFIHIKRDGLGA